MGNGNNVVEQAKMAEAVNSFVYETGFDADSGTGKTAGGIVLQDDLLDQMFDAVCVLDMHFTITYWNRIAEKILGWSRNEAIGKPYAEIFHTDVPAAKQQDNIAKMMKQGHLAGEALHYRKNGAPIWVSMHAGTRRSKDGQFKGVILSFRDATEIREYERRLAERDMEYQEIIDSSALGAFVHDIQKGEAAYSAEWKKKLGAENLSPKELARLPETHVHPDDLARINEIYENALAKRSPRVSMEFRAKTNAGYIWVLGQAKIQYDGNGNPLKIFGTHIDISEQKKILQELEFQAGVLEKVHDAVFAFNEDLKLCYMNQMAKRNTSYRPEEMMGEDIFTHMRQFGLEESFENTGNILLRDGEFKGEVQATGKDGRYVWGDVHIQLLYKEDGSFDGSVATISDITDRKQAEEQLAFQAEVLSNVHDAVFAFNADKKLCYMNHMAVQSAGFSPEEMLGQDIFTHMRQLGLESAMEKTSRILESEGEFRGEVKATRKDGKHAWGDVNIKLLKNNGGGYCGSVVTINDITERKQIEEQLALQADVLAGVHDAVLAFTKDFDVCYWNRMAEEITGILSRDILGRNAFEIQEIISVEHEDLQRIKRCLMEKSIFTGEIRVRRLDGSVLWGDVHIKYTSGQGGGLYGTVVTCRDITERKQAEEELKAVEMHLANEVEVLEKLHLISTQYLNTNDVRRIYSEILDSAILLTGADKGNIKLGDEKEKAFKVIAYRDMGKRQLDHPEIIPYGSFASRTAYTKKRRVIYQNVKKAEILIGTIQREILLEEGVMAGQSTPLLSSSGTVWGVLTTHYREEHVFQERELRTLDVLARLAADIIETSHKQGALMNSEMQARKLVEELREADINKNEFLNMLSHELRNPLAAISAGIQLMSLSQEKEIVAKARDVIRRQMDQLCRLTDDLLDLTRISNNKIRLKKEQVELCSLACLVAEDNRTLFEEKGVALKTETANTQLLLEADPVRLRQAVGNLLNNAMKFTNAGDEVVLRVYAEGEEALVTVSDTGIGVEGDLLPHLFEPFRQADISLERKNSGLGLGLSITRGIAELHGGSVSAYSAGLNRGSSFTIRLPAQPMQTVMQKGDSAGSTAGLLCILVIEDNPDLSEMLCLALHKMGHRAEQAPDGLQGIKKALEIKPHVIFCDIGLAGMDGFAVAKAIRSEPLLLDTQLVALTGYASDLYKKRALDAGFDMHALKPLDDQTLEQLLKSIPKPNRP